MLAKRPSYMSGPEYREVLEKLNLTPSSAAKILHVNPRTSRRWASGETPINARTAMLLRQMAKGKIITIKA